MPAWLEAVPIERPDVLGTVYAVTAALLAAVALPWPGVRGRPLVRAAVLALGAGIGALAGWLAVWWVVDVQDVFGAPASDVIRGAACGGGAAAGVGIAALVRGRWWRRVVAALLVPLAIGSAGLAVNRDVAYFPTLGDALGQSAPPTLPTKPVVTSLVNLSAWKAPADLPTVGRVYTVDIPGTASHFAARSAWVYLPPAALVTGSRPRLPVVIAMSGQPGGPSDVFEAGGIQSVLDDIASEHHGVAPIVVVPDQLGAYDANPMCVNGALGDVETYVLQDVRQWVLANLPVATGRQEWTAAGFSQGGTCAVQFATGYPAVFGSFIAVSPELGPTYGSRAHTIKAGFHGDVKAWAAAQPIAIMRRHHRYRDTAAVYSVGADDRRYGTATPILAAESRKVGMHVTFTELPGLGHNWNTGAAGLTNGFDTLLGWWGIR